MGPWGDSGILRDSNFETDHPEQSTLVKFHEEYGVPHGLLRVFIINVLYKDP
jgi:hypothetical protein